MSTYILIPFIPFVILIVILQLLIIRDETDNNRDNDATRKWVLSLPKKFRGVKESFIDFWREKE